MSETNLIIDVSQLCKTFDGKQVVKDVSLKVGHGEIFGFLGPNGSGKTTTIRMLCGLLTPDHGHGTCLGYDILTQTHQIRRHIGYIPQFFSLYKQLTVYQNIRLMAELYGVVDRTNRIEAILNRLGLESRRNQVSATLSGGWKQRLALAAALIHNPFLLLLDEPTASVDPESRREFWELMHSLAAEGMTVLLSSHNMDEVERCHRIAYICNGQILMDGKIKDIIHLVKLTTWQVQGKNIILLAKELEVIPGVDQIITFFDSLHVSGRDPEALEKAIQPYRSNVHFQWQKVDTTLDDVFIWLTKKRIDLEV